MKSVGVCAILQASIQEVAASADSVVTIQEIQENSCEDAGLIPITSYQECQILAAEKYKVTMTLWFISNAGYAPGCNVELSDNGDPTGRVFLNSQGYGSCGFSWGTENTKCLCLSSTGSEPAPSPPPPATGSVWVYGKCNDTAQCVEGAACGGNVSDAWRGCEPDAALMAKANGGSGCEFWNTCTNDTSCCQTEGHPRYCSRWGYCQDTPDVTGPTPTAAPASLYAYQKCNNQAECGPGTLCQGDQYWKGCIPDSAEEAKANCTFYGACDDATSCCETEGHPRHCWSTGYCSDTEQPPSATIAPGSVKENGYCTADNQCEAVSDSVVDGSINCIGNICTPTGCAGIGGACTADGDCCSTVCNLSGGAGSGWCDASR